MKNLTKHLLLLFFGFFFLFNTFNTINSAYGAGNCITKFGFGAPYCGGSTDICGPKKYLNDKCNGPGNKKTGSECCTQLRYDSCGGQLDTAGVLSAGAGDCTNVNYQWSCCDNLTPTPYPCIANGGDCIGASYVCLGNSRPSSLSCPPSAQCCTPIPTPTPASTCDFDKKPDGCGSTSQWCYQGKCGNCTSGYLNCDQTEGCEYKGSSCPAPTPTPTYDQCKSKCFNATSDQNLRNSCVKNLCDPLLPAPTPTPKLVWNKIAVCTAPASASTPTTTPFSCTNLAGFLYTCSTTSDWPANQGCATGWSKASENPNTTCRSNETCCYKGSPSTTAAPTATTAPTPTTAPIPTIISTITDLDSCYKSCGSDESFKTLKCQFTCNAQFPPTPTPTLAPGVIAPTSTPTPTPTPTSTPSPTPTLIPPGKTFAKFKIALSGIVDNPKHTTRKLKIEVFDPLDNNAKIADLATDITHDPLVKQFKGTNVLDAISKSGIYNIKVKSDGYLRKLILPVQINLGQQVDLGLVKLIPGDIDGDNKIDLIDYNLFISCYGTKADKPTCDKKVLQLSDFNDDIVIDGIDYNTFIKGLSVKEGD